MAQEGNEAGRDTPAIEVTEAMIRAGLVVLDAGGEHYPEETLLREIYTAMAGQAGTSRA